MAVLDNASESPARLFQFRRPALPASAKRLSVGHRRGNCLADLMSDRGGQLAQGFYACDVRELSLHATQRLFGARLHQADPRLLELTCCLDALGNVARDLAKPINWPLLSLSASMTTLAKKRLPFFRPRQVVRPPYRPLRAGIPIDCRDRFAAWPRRCDTRSAHSRRRGRLETPRRAEAERNAAQVDRGRAMSPPMTRPAPIWAMSDFEVARSAESSSLIGSSLCARTPRTVSTSQRVDLRAVA